LIRCSAFCLSLNEGHARKAASRAGRIGRKRTAPTLSEKVGSASVVAIPLGKGSGLPVVHGWLASDPANGEFSMLSQEEGMLLASRDVAGTRPLYVSRTGRWVSSDHRFFPDEEADLLNPGWAYDALAGRIVSKRPTEARFRGSFEDAVVRLAGLVDEAVRERVSGAKKVAVAFSGGLDSSLLALCAKKHTKVLATAVGVRGSRDSAGARQAADAVGVELLQAEVDGRALKKELAALDLPFETTPMDRSLWCMYSVASRTASEAGAELVLLGQLADELFGGYVKYRRALAEQGAEAAALMMKGDVEGCGRRGFVRDEAACSRWLEPRFPFADRRILELGLGLPVDFKIRQGVRKAVLREAAALMGLPEEICSAPKKAAQYSSGIQKLVG
jgi:asparagine synthase (glutamine-hydrolysing)